jgi:hypothetical protein
MSNGLATQIRGTFEALDDAQAPVTVEEIMQSVGSVRLLPIGEVQAGARGKRLPLLVAAGAAVLAVAVVGAVAWLAPVADKTPPAEQPNTATTVPGQDTVPEGDASIEVPASIVAEAVTPSSIGDASWTIYEGDPTDIVAELSRDAPNFINWGLGVRAGDLPAADESLLGSLMSVDGIALDVYGRPLGSAGPSTVHRWSVDVDCIETALSGGSVAVSPNEFVRVYGEQKFGEISVLASDALTPPTITAARTWSIRSGPLLSTSGLQPKTETVGPLTWWTR